MNHSDIIIKKLKDSNNPALIDLYGDDKHTVKIQGDRYIDLISRFTKKFGESDGDFFSSPGRTEIGGNHTDHNHGRVLAGAVNLDNIAFASRNSNNTIYIESTGYPGFEVHLDNLTPVTEEKYSSASLVRGICAKFKELGYTIGGFNAIIDGQVPKGSGLSSSASFEVLIGAILSHLYNKGAIDPIQNAIVGQYSENNFFGKPCGLMDQVACSLGGLVTIDFKDPAHPVVKKVNFNFTNTGFYLIITDTGGNHADLNDEYAAVPSEMKAVAAELGANVLRDVTLDEVVKIIPKIREKTGDRSILRALHFLGENQRVVNQVEALEKNEFDKFLGLVIDSGRSSYMYNQNVYPVTNIREQGVSLALALSEMILKGKGAWRVHGGGFAGTVQAFVPKEFQNRYIDTLEQVFGKGACSCLFIRSKGSVKVEI